MGATIVVVVAAEAEAIQKKIDIDTNYIFLQLPIQEANRAGSIKIQKILLSMAT